MPSRFVEEITPSLVESRDLELAAPAADAADEDAFARECLAKLRAMTGSSD